MSDHTHLDPEGERHLAFHLENARRVTATAGAVDLAALELVARRFPVGEDGDYHEIRLVVRDRAGHTVADLILHNWMERA